MSVSRKARSIPARWLGAFKKGHRYSDREHIDEDQAWELLLRWEKSKGTDKEAEEALDYLTKFNNEYYKNVVSKTDALHECKCPDRKRGDKHLEGCLRNSLNDRQNAKNRDIMSIQNRNNPSANDIQSHFEDDTFEGGLDYLDAMTQQKEASYNPEDALIELIDLQRELDKQREDDDTEY